MKTENKIPYFKEKENEQFYYKDGIWIKCKESLIDSLWRIWVSSKDAIRWEDEDGFLVFGYENKEIPITFCYKFSEDIEVLKQKLTIGKDYLFSDMLQEEKSFKVEWEKRTLDKIERHPNSANCFVSGLRYFSYVKELNDA